MLLHGSISCFKLNFFFPPVVITMTNSVLPLRRVSQYQTAALPLVQGITLDTLQVKHTLFGALCVVNRTNKKIVNDILNFVTW